MSCKETGMCKSAAACFLKGGCIEDDQPAPTAAPEQVASLEGRTVSVDVSTGEHDAGNRIFADLTGETGSDGTTLLAIEQSGNFSQPSEAEPLADLPNAAALLYNALNDAYQSSLFDGEELRTVVRALAAYNRCRSAAPSLPAAPAPLDADEMTRLRRLMRAIGWDHERDESDRIVRGTLFTVLGEAAGRIERAGAAPAAGDELREALQTIARWELPATGKTWPSGGAVSYEAEHGSNGARDYMRQVALNALAHQPAQEQAELRDLLTELTTTQRRLIDANAQIAALLLEKGHAQAAQHEAGDELKQFENYFCMTLSCDDSEPAELVEAARAAACDAWMERARRAAASPVVRAQSEESGTTGGAA